MSLLRLLTTGKSLVGVKDTESRYRVTGERLLPQFGSAKNPFSSPGKSEPALPAAGPAATQVGNGVSAGGAFRSASVERAPVVPRGALRSKAAALLSGWKSRIGGLLPRPRAAAVKPAIPRFTKPAVQGELSLDKIKVVRNDLSDADLEVVPAKAPATPAVEPDLGAETAVGRIAARVPGVRKT